jgi:exopolyphosphatase/guanosine-5'-triphosphate,3'-diphosphate pyrophosphatase
VISRPTTTRGGRARVFGAIDVGSNASRLLIAGARQDGGLDTVEYIREPLRLGHDVFSAGALSEKTIARAIAVFQLFRRALDRHQVERVRACATSATRDARNRDLFLSRVARQSGLHLELTSGAEEANLLRQAASARMDLGGHTALLVDVGGGSTEVSLVEGGEVQLSESFDVGTVRMLEAFEKDGRSAKDAQRLMAEFVDRLALQLRQRFDDVKVDLLVATGGNIEAAANVLAPAQARAAAEGHGVVTLPVERVKILRKQLEELPLAARVKRFKLKEDRADVLVPALHIYQRIARAVGASELHVPFVGLVNGIVASMVAGELPRTRGDNPRARQVRTSALVHGRRFAFDEAHATKVAELALRIFDATGDLHRLDEDCRILVEAAALLHDLGAFVEPRRHHKHSLYLISNLEIVGLSQRERLVVASIARYHRKSLPTTHHEHYAALTEVERDQVSRLAAILRIADALDREHGGLVTDLVIDRRAGELILRPVAARDILLEAWSLERRSDLFEQIFGWKVRLVTGGKAKRPARAKKPAVARA